MGASPRGGSAAAVSRVSFDGLDSLRFLLLLVFASQSEKGEDAVEPGPHDAAEAEEDKETDANEDTDHDSSNGTTAQTAIWSRGIEKRKRASTSSRRWYERLSGRC